jgi:hypothetical protein
VLETPGHTNCSISLATEGASPARVFTGDALLIRGCGRTDFQQGSPARLFRSVKDQILSLPSACLLYPAHDYRGLTVTSVGEEQQFNPRLGGNVDAADFAGYMNNLGLPHPKLMDIAVPANLRCGRPDAMASLPVEPGWAPLTCNFGGVWEIQPAALDERIAGGRRVTSRSSMCANPPNSLTCWDTCMAHGCCRCHNWPHAPMRSSATGLW